MRYTMPVLDAANSPDGVTLSDESLAFLARITTNRKGERRLRATKPKGDGEACYVWRMTAFFLSKNPTHQCMPVCADMDMPRHASFRDSDKVREASWQAHRARLKELDVVVDEIGKLVPVTNQPGTMRWGRALGMI